MKLQTLITVFSFLLLFSSSSYGVEKSLKNAQNVYFVSPSGSDMKSGKTAENSFKTIQHALNLAHAGETIVLLKGEYYEDLHSVRSGENGKPIRITGMSGSILKGEKNSRIFEINHSYIELSNFSINGKVGKGDKLKHYRDKLIYIKGLKDKGVKGVKILGMNLKYAYGECVRIKYLASYNEIAYTKIGHCGLRDFVFNRGKNNGESIYIGTAPEQIIEGKNPTKVVDSSHKNWIHHNIIESYGSECIDVKEGSHSNLLEYNICTKQKDKNVGGISIRGNKNIIRKNIIFNNDGAGIRLGGDTKDDGLNNEVYGNYLSNNAQGALKIMSNPRKNSLCGNNIFTINNQKRVRTKSRIKFIIKECN
ncbi:MAG: hypothetical protein DRG78_03585 [Epsilonproteobacteria bacterium]|nr:MAG: hypothetical protein DRG78_03585 [Campylobacterota bacterium]